MTDTASPLAAIAPRQTKNATFSPAFELEQFRQALRSHNVLAATLVQELVLAVKLETVVTEVVANLRRYFNDGVIHLRLANADADYLLELQVHDPRDIEEALDVRQRFFQEWWLDQGVFRRMTVAVFVR